MQSQSRLVSVISISKNNPNGLKNSLNSLMLQSYVKWESIIVIASSDDTSLEVAMSFVRKDNRFRFVIQSSEMPGIYGAMNLGIHNISENSVYLSFMNAGDEFSSQKSLEIMCNSLQDANLGLVIGGYRVKGLSIEYPQKPGNLTELFFTFARRGGCHQAVLFHTSGVLEIGGYDSSFELASDHDLILKVIRKYGAKKIGAVVAAIEGNGTSDTNLRKLHLEKQKVRSIFFRDQPLIIIFGKIWTFAAVSNAWLRSR